MIGTRQAQDFADRAWNQLGDYLEDGDGRLLSNDDRGRLSEDWRDVSRQAAHLEDALVIGLVGGTGVGKSTFINALAGEVVSRSGDRRPTTNRVVVYRHTKTDLPTAVPLEDLSQPQVQHSNDELTKVILLDFPDFDSAERSHTHIIEKYLPYLDVILIVVDDVKYADRRLYELLSSLCHSDANLFVLLNKVDRLRTRYEETAEAVVAEMLADLSSKLKKNANLNIPEDHLFPISAYSVLMARTNNQPTEDMPRFEKIEELLAGFQGEKHRRQVKERNLDVRKNQLADQLNHLALSDDNRRVLKETQAMVEKWQGELSRTLTAISSEIFSERERRSLRKSRLRKVGPKWGLPFSLVFTALGEMPWSRSGAQLVETSDLGSRIQLHYRGFFEAIRNLASRFQAEFVGANMAGESAKSDSPLSASSLDQLAIEAAGTAQQQIQKHREGPSRFVRGLWHLPAIGTLVLAVWSRIYPLIDSVTDDEAGGFFTALARAFIGSLNPMFIIGVLLALILAYVITSLILWTREVQKLDGDIQLAESQIRECVHERGNEVIGNLDEQVKSLRREFEQVESILH